MKIPTDTAEMMIDERLVDQRTGTESAHDSERPFQLPPRANPERPYLLLDGHVITVPSGRV